ncbi:hypothetical protein [Polynucleobacter sp. CS-Odin-A6]|uniref:hypothetical protein n=1 Tax=Polynucleobacter sp. CS-Odin-A6 TaxID=2689106 RepID=UPI001C0C335C|nr:hypothetical protein [Polynucleobacter sp. CS-Odin-A6]MBU3620807.1 hypothetical protein [Polynucleobacter sp. CS-Odin-A6]
MNKVITCLILSCGLIGCGQDYTTWSCSNSPDSKFTMVLKKAVMQFQDRQYDYCGSLGPQSYFDAKCTVRIQDASHVFTTDSGKLVSNGKEFQCNAL